MSLIILFFAIVVFFSTVTNKLSDKLGMPSLLLFMFLGILFGSDGILKLPFDDYSLTSKMCTVGLFLIIFYGGFCTKKPEDKKVTIMSILLSSFGTIFTAILTSLFCFYCLKMPMIESFLVASILSSTDAASVFSILRSKKLNLKYNTAPLLEIESGSNDPFAYVLVIIGLMILKNGSFSFEFISIFLAQILLGVLFGVVFAFVGIYIFRKTKLIKEGNDVLFVLALAAIAFSLSDLSGGNGYLSVYLTGIILGNSEIKNKINLLHFFDGVTGLCQISIFFLLGFLSFPHKFFEIFKPTLFIALFLAFVARPVAVSLIMLPFKAKLKQIVFVSLAGLKGAASIVFAILVVAQAGEFSYDLFHIVFFVSFVSVALQGSFLPFFAKKLDMIDKYSNVLKTFNDYQKDFSITLSKIFITKTHPWLNKPIKDINLYKDSIVLVIYRNGCKVHPKGDTVILLHDLILIGTNVVYSSSDIKLKEMEIDANHEWKNKLIKNIEFERGFLIALIKRGDASFVPNGETKILKDDILVFYSI